MQDYIGTEMKKVKELIFNIEDVLADAGAVPFTKKVGVDRELLYSILDEMRMIVDDMANSLPGEIQHAKRTINDREKIVAEARSRAEGILQGAREQEKRLVAEHEITKKATEQAAAIIDEAKRSAREMRVNSIGYADDVLENAEVNLREALELMSRKYSMSQAVFSETIDFLYRNRQELRGENIGQRE
jgi:vacuolar-type H+-ATPase subunit H